MTDAAGSIEDHSATERPRSLKRILGVGALVAFGLAYLVPLTVFTTFGTATRLTEGRLPTAYIVTTIAMFFTALSYAALVKKLPSSGSAFAYASRAFGERTGFLVGWALLLDYILLPAINYLIIGIYLHAQFPQIPAAAVILSAIAMVTFLNVIGIDVVRNASLALVAGQLVFAALFVWLVLSRAELSPSLLTPFYTPDMQWPGIFAGAAILCLSFLGFDAVSTLSEEARDPDRTVPRAILLTTLLGGGIFILLAYAATLMLPDWTSIKVSDSAGLEVVAPLGGPLLVAAFLTAFVGGCIASAIASQASVARVLYAMGRDRVLPEKLFGVLSDRFRTPVRATLVVAAVSLVVLLTDLDTLASIISVGALSAFSAVNLSVPKIFLIDDGLRGPRAFLLYGVLPLIGFAFTAWLWLSLSRHALTVGLVWLAAGACYLAYREFSQRRRAASAS